MTLSTPTGPAIEVVGLTKAYGDQVVLDGLDLTVPRGTVSALLGPNGAGKTTTVQILSTLLPPDGGLVRVLGHDLLGEPDAVRAGIGVTGQFSAVDDLLTGAENLTLMGDLHHLSRGERSRRTTELVEQLDLADVVGRPASTLSGGTRRRLDLAMTLIGRPRLIFLDEPTTGLDPRSRRVVWGIVRELVASGVTVFLTTQYLEEADQLADRVAVLDDGRLVAEGTPAELKRRVAGGSIRLRFADATALDTAAPVFPGSVRDDRELTLSVPGDGHVSSLRGVLDRLELATVGVADLSVHTPDLDDVFLALTGQREQEGTLR
jgi:ABC-2 type transport system ATP-binding protein